MNVQKMGWLVVTVFFLVGVGCGDPGTDDTDDIPGDHIYQSEEGHFELLRISTTPSPPQTGDNTFEIEIFDAETNEEIVDADLTVEPWMPAHDHGTDTEPEVSAGDHGRYTISNVNFTMAGDWELRIDIDDGERSDRVVMPVQVQ